MNGDPQCMCGIFSLNSTVTSEWCVVDISTNEFIVYIANCFRICECEDTH